MNSKFYILFSNYLESLVLFTSAVIVFVPRLTTESWVWCMTKPYKIVSVAVGSRGICQSYAMPFFFSMEILYGIIGSCSFPHLQDLTVSLS